MLVNHQNVGHLHHLVVDLAHWSGIVQHSHRCTLGNLGTMLHRFVWNLGLHYNYARLLDDVAQDVDVLWREQCIGTGVNGNAVFAVAVNHYQCYSGVFTCYGYYSGSVDSLVDEFQLELLSEIVVAKSCYKIHFSAQPSGSHSLIGSFSAVGLHEFTSASSFAWTW